MAKILIFGLTGGGEQGQYERQLGNAAILIPMGKMLRKYIAESEIHTTIQLTDNFQKEYAITSIPNFKKLLPRFNTIPRLFIILVNLIRASLWRFFKEMIHVNIPILVKGGTLEKFLNYDIALDFNGDIFPSDAGNILRPLGNVLDVFIIRQLGIPVVEFVSSPGPFNSFSRKLLSKFMYKKISVFTNREPISSQLLKDIGIKKVPIVNTACPAFLLESASERVKEIFMQEKVDIGVRPLIGITLAGYNLFSQHTWGKPASFNDLKLFVPMLKYLLDDLNANVFLLPHVYRMNQYIHDFELINGPDYDILLHLYRMVEGEKYGERLNLIKGKYTASEAKAIIGQCDLYISGRLHAGVAALSQFVPTVLVAYGHKHFGFARLLKVEDYVYQGTSSEELLQIVKKAWENRDEITKTLKNRMSRVTELAKLNFEIVKEIIDLNEKERNRIPKNVSEKWITKGEQI